MKFFIDTANVEAIRKYAFCLDGVTTNPSLIAKEGRKFDEVVREITRIVDGPISAETVEESAEGMVKDARKLAKIHKNIYVKIPMTVEGMKAVRVLSKEGIKTNVTLVFSPTQALIAAKAGATVVSPFIGRLDDISTDGMQLIREIVTIFKNYSFKTEVLVASVRHPMHVVQAALAGAHIITVPPDVLGKLFQHPLTGSGIEKFLKDYRTIPK